MVADPNSSMLGRVLTELSDLRDELKVVRESVIRMETHGYGQQIAELRLDSRETRDKVLVIETKGKIAAGVVAAAVSVLVMVLGGVFLYALHIPVHIG